MLDPALATHALERLRDGLQAKGDFARFLLAEADRALASGVEEYQDEITYTAAGQARRSGKQAVARRQPDQAEALLTLLQVIHAYLVDLPAAAASAARDLAAHMPLESLTVTFHSDVEAEQPFAEMREDVDLLSLRDALQDPDVEREVRRLEALIVGTEPEDQNAPAHT